MPPSNDLRLACSVVDGLHRRIGVVTARAGQAGAIDRSALVAAHGSARLVAGVSLLLAPRWLRRLVLGDARADGPVRAVLAALGARDLLVGERLLAARDDWPTAVGWLRRAAALDAVDAIAFAVTRRTPLAAGIAALTAAATLATPTVARARG